MFLSISGAHIILNEHFQKHNELINKMSLNLLPSLNNFVTDRIRDRQKRARM